MASSGLRIPLARLEVGGRGFCGGDGLQRPCTPIPLHRYPKPNPKESPRNQK